MSIATSIMARAYTLAPQDLDHASLTLHGVPWAEMVKDLEFTPWDTGGGCMMLVGDTRWGTRVGITGGDAELPESEESFWLGIMDGDGEERYTLEVLGGVIEWRGGDLP